jgi:hypothetical protein
MSDEDAENENLEGGGPGVVTDLLGLGAAAKSPAAKEIVKALSKALGTIIDPARTLLMGLARNKVEANKIVAIARAEASARMIAVESEGLIERMKERIVAQEIGRQINIELAASEAINTAELESPTVQAVPVDNDWMAAWLEGVKDVSDAELRTLWARLLASQSRSDGERVSGPALQLLRTLDADLGRALLKFVAFVLIYECYPFHRPIQPPILERKPLVLLQELGFVRQVSLYAFKFKYFYVRFAGTFTMMHDVLELTDRARELCLSLLGGNAFETVLRDEGHSSEQQVDTYVSLIDAAMQLGPTPITLGFDRPNAEKPIELALNRPGVIYSLDFEALMRTFTEKGASLSEVPQEVLRRLQERGVKFTTSGS